MRVKVYPGPLRGSITAPGSKSHMQRVLLAALLQPGETIIRGKVRAADESAMTDMIRSLGARIEAGKDEMHIRGIEIPEAGNAPIALNAGESGLAARMVTPVASLFPDEISITGSGSLMNRPMHFFEDVLPKLGVSVCAKSGKLPLRIKGPLTPADIEIDGSLSSQFLSGLLFAFAYAAVKPVVIKVNNLTSKPYIDITLDVLKQFGYNVQRDDKYTAFRIEGKPVTRQPSPISLSVEGDWSGAAFFLVAKAMGNKIDVTGLNERSAQADRAVMQVLAKDITAFDFDATDCPDLFPPLVALAANSKGTSNIRGVHRLKSKESDRGAALIDVFSRLGIEIRIDDDVMFVEGGRIQAATVHSHHDHRIAMAAAIAALNADGPVTIENAEAVNKSYPDFFEHLKSLGARVEIT